MQAGLTVQRSLYDSPEEWSADKEHLSDEERHSDRILRTPDVYGYFTATFNPTKALSVALNGNYTGRMYVPHLMSEVDGTADLLVKSPDFFELGAKVAYDIDFPVCACNSMWEYRISSTPIRKILIKEPPAIPVTFMVRERLVPTLRESSLVFSARRVCLVLPFMLPLKKISCISA